MKSEQEIRKRLEKLERLVTQPICKTIEDFRLKSLYESIIDDLKWVLDEEN